MNSVIDSDGHVFDDLRENDADPACRDRWQRRL